jgi:hypothetical protein
MGRIAVAAVAIAAGLGTFAGIAGCGVTGTPAPAKSAPIPARQLRLSVANAYSFLNQMMDRYGAGPTPRLVQSFAGGVLGQRRFTASETYDDAVLIDAYLAAGTFADRSRAKIIGNGLLYVQAHDPLHDGRVRAAYAPAPLRSPVDVTAVNAASLAGDMAWAGQALVQLYSATGKQAYLTAAEAIGDWVQANCYDTRGAGGFTGGQTAAGQKIEWKSTEHNIDLYAFFTLLAGQTGKPVWSVRAAWAKRFVAAMWNPAQGRFYVGTTTDGTTRNDGLLAEDVNSWSYLALRDPAYAASVSWDMRNLAVNGTGTGNPRAGGSQGTDGTFSGVSFCTRDRTGVWFEGTAHLVDALEARDAPGDAEMAEDYLADIYHAQAHGLNTNGTGVIAASRDRLSDCGGGFYYASLHTGTTAWYILAAERVDPFSLIFGA